jgi:hypothetical protein
MATVSWTVAAQPGSPDSDVGLNLKGKSQVGLLSAHSPRVWTGRTSTPSAWTASRTLLIHAAGLRSSAFVEEEVTDMGVLESDAVSKVRGHPLSRGGIRSLRFRMGLPDAHRCDVAIVQ